MRISSASTATSSQISYFIPRCTLNAVPPFGKFAFFFLTLFFPTFSRFTLFQVKCGNVCFRRNSSISRNSYLNSYGDSTETQRNKEPFSISAGPKNTLRNARDKCKGQMMRPDIDKLNSFSFLSQDNLKTNIRNVYANFNIAGGWEMHLWWRRSFFEGVPKGVQVWEENITEAERDGVMTLMRSLAENMPIIWKGEVQFFNGLKKFKNNGLWKIEFLGGGKFIGNAW